MISVNGRAVPWKQTLTITGIFCSEGYRLKTPPVYVTVNGEKIEKWAWDSFLVPDGADVGIVRFLQGG